MITLDELFDNLLVTDIGDSIIRICQAITYISSVGAGFYSWIPLRRGNSAGFGMTQIDCKGSAEVSIRPCVTRSAKQYYMAIYRSFYLEEITPCFA